MTPAERVAELAAAMRAVGAGRGSLDGLSLDLTVAPMALSDRDAKPAEQARPRTTAEAKAEYERTLFASAGGARRKLPL